MTSTSRLFTSRDLLVLWMQRMEIHQEGEGAGSLSVLKYQSVWPSKCSYVFKKF